MNNKEFYKNVKDMVKQSDLDFDTEQPVMNTKDYLTFEIVPLPTCNSLIAKSHEEAEKEFRVLFNEYIEEYEVGEGFEWHELVCNDDCDIGMPLKKGEHVYELFCKDFYITNDLSV